VANQFSIGLGLTEQQKQQIVPLLEQELKQLGALKKDTSLSALKKVEQLRQLGASFDEKIKPLLNPEQQQKFQVMRDQMRKRLIEKMASEAAGKLEKAATQDLETLKQEVGRGVVRAVKQGSTRWAERPARSALRKLESELK